MNMNEETILIFPDISYRIFRTTIMYTWYHTRTRVPIRASWRIIMIDTLPDTRSVIVHTAVYLCLGGE